MSDGPVTVLVADDSAFFRRYICDLLKGAGFEVLVARNGAELLALLDEHETKVSLIISDVVMPKGNAFDLLPVIRGKKPREELRVLLLSELAQPEDVQKLRDLGADGFIHKQAPAEQVLFRVRQTLDLDKVDRRVAPRHLLDVPLHYDGEGCEGYGRLFNLSLSGAYVMCLNPEMAVGSVMRIEFALPGEKVVALEGRVVRAVRTFEEEPFNADPPGFALTFDKLDDGVRATIEAWARSVE